MQISLLSLTEYKHFKEVFWKLYALGLFPEFYGIHSVFVRAIIASIRLIQLLDPTPLSSTQIYVLL